MKKANKAKRPRTQSKVEGGALRALTKAGRKLGFTPTADEKWAAVQVIRDARKRAQG